MRLSGDGIGVPYHTSTRLRDPWIKNIANLGAGPIGLGNIMMQSYLGRRVIAVDIAPYRLDLAKKLGAAEVVDARTGDVVKQIRALTNSLGPEVCLEAAGKPKTCARRWQPCAPAARWRSTASNLKWSFRPAKT